MSRKPISLNFYEVPVTDRQAVIDFAQKVPEANDKIDHLAGLADDGPQELFMVHDAVTKRDTWMGRERGL